MCSRDQVQGPEPEKPLGELKSSGNVIRFVVLKAPSGSLAQDRV